MINIRRANERGHANHGWLDSYHTFSFSDYYDPNFMSFRALRVINEDHVQPGKGFPTHAHEDMEILTYVLEGALEHKDSLGTGSVIHPGDVQLMTAGTGIRHSEFNPSDKDPLHLLQIWIMPATVGDAPEYRQKSFPAETKTDLLCLVASRDAREGSLNLRQDADIYAAVLNARTELVHPLAKGRHAWLQVVRGDLEVNGQLVSAGDGAAISDEVSVRVKSVADNSECLLFDLE